MTDTLPLSIQPVISYPKEAEVGKTYLMEIDLQMPESGFEWQYEEEEYLIYCMVNAGNLFTVTSVGEPAIVLHRFGGTYGNAKFLLEAAQEENEGEIKITLVNSWGVPIKIINLKEVVKKHQQNKQEILTSNAVSDFLPTGNIWQKTTASIDQRVNKSGIKQSPKVNQSIPSNIRQGAVNFVGREKELAEIHAKLLEGQGVVVCSLGGMGGVGKTELALQYATRYQQEYVARYWLSLRETGLAQAVVTMASPYLDLPESMQSASLDDQAAWCWQNWIPTEGKVLVIFDDVTEIASIPKQARPLSDRFQILVTTRNRKLSSQFTEYDLEGISESDALELLRKLLGKSRVDRELTAAQAICEYLGYLPLGLELAGRYLQLDEDLRLSDYRQQLTITNESLNVHEAEESTSMRGVIAAFELSWQELDDPTGKVALLLGLFAPADIAWSLVAEIAAQLNVNAGDLQEARKQLNNLYLIKARNIEGNHFTLHPQMREFFRYKLMMSDPITQQNIYYTVLGLISHDVVLAKELIVPTLEKFNPFFDNSIKSIDYARLIRESRKSWYEGFGALSQMIGRTNHDGSLPKIGAYIYDSNEDPESKNILYGENYGEEYDEYFELPEEIVNLHRQELFSILFEDKKFLSFSTSFGNKSLDIPLISEYSKLSKKLSEIIGNNCSLPTDNSTLMKESAWYAAYFLTGKYPLKYFPRTIPVIEIEDCFASDSQWSSAVSSYQRNCLQIVFEKLRSNGVEEFIYPWDSRYSQDPQEVLNFVTTVYQESLSAYQDLVKRWFGNFTRHLQTLNMFPIAIEGVVITSPDGTYSLDWYWIPLKEGDSNRVKFKLSKDPMTEDEISIVLSSKRENENQFISVPHYRYTSSNLFTPKFPVTHIVYGWLWKDLEKLKLVSGSFAPHIW